MRREIDVWVEQAEKDLEAAEINYNQKLYYVCAFLCQQAIEKMMKAVYMIQYKENAPIAHNPRELGEKIGFNQKTSFQKQESFQENL